MDDTDEWLNGSESDPIKHVVVLIREGHLKVAGVFSKPPEKIPFKFPPHGTAGLGEFELYMLAKGFEKRYGNALSSETTFDIRKTSKEPWPPIAKITAVILTTAKQMGLPFRDATRYWIDIQWAEGVRNICWCAVRERNP